MKNKNHVNQPRFYDEAVKPVLQLQKKCFFGSGSLQKRNSRGFGRSALFLFGREMEKRAWVSPESEEIINGYKPICRGKKCLQAVKQS